MKSGTGRRGVALFAALSLLALLGLLTIGAFASTILSQRAERSHQSNDLLDAAADYAATTVLSRASQLGLGDLPLGAARAIDVTVPQSDRVHTTVSATRFPNGILWLIADVNLSGTEVGHRRMALLARFRTIAAMPPAGVVTRGGISLGDSVSVTTDTSGDVDCRAAGSVPPTAQRADSAAYLLTAAQLAALDSAASVRHVHGDTLIAGGAFSGVLIADGNVTIAGPFTLDGLLVARGRISATELTVRGAMMAYSADTSAVQLAKAQVDYSPCAVAHAFRTALPPRPVRLRNWSDLRD